MNKIISIIFFLGSFVMISSVYANNDELLSFNIDFGRSKNITSILKNAQQKPETTMALLFAGVKQHDARIVSSLVYTDNPIVIDWLKSYSRVYEDATHNASYMNLEAGRELLLRESHKASILQMDYALAKHYLMNISISNNMGEMSFLGKKYNAIQIDGRWKIVINEHANDLTFASVDLKRSSAASDRLSAAIQRKSLDTNEILRPHDVFITRTSRSINDAIGRSAKTGRLVIQRPIQDLFSWDYRIESIKIPANIHKTKWVIFFYRVPLINGLQTKTIPSIVLVSPFYNEKGASFETDVVRRLTTDCGAMTVSFYSSEKLGDGELMDAVNLFFRHLSVKYKWQKINLILYSFSSGALGSQLIANNIRDNAHIKIWGCVAQGANLYFNDPNRFPWVVVKTVDDRDNQKHAQEIGRHRIFGSDSWYIEGDPIWRDFGQANFFHGPGNDSSIFITEFLRSILLSIDEGQPLRRTIHQGVELPITPWLPSDYWRLTDLPSSSLQYLSYRLPNLMDVELSPEVRIHISGAIVSPNRIVFFMLSSKTSSAWGIHSYTGYVTRSGDIAIAFVADKPSRSDIDAIFTFLDLRYGNRMLPIDVVVDGSVVSDNIDYLKSKTNVLRIGVFLTKDKYSHNGLLSVRNLGNKGDIFVFTPFMLGELVPELIDEYRYFSQQLTIIGAPSASFIRENLFHPFIGIEIMRSFPDIRYLEEGIFFK